jgi:hypothetical protein
VDGAGELSPLDPIFIGSSYSFSFVEQVDDLYTDWTGWTAELVMRDRCGTIFDTLTTGDGITISDDDSGHTNARVSVSFAPDRTAVYQSQIADYFLRMLKDDGTAGQEQAVVELIGQFTIALP